jgi:NADH:ubiquinone oxidoreductase subunit 3 (subunit A)
MALIIFSIIIIFIISILYILNYLLSYSSFDFQKFSSYECGFEPIYSNARLKFDILYWIIGILYLIFDLELIFIFPLATILND